LRRRPLKFPRRPVEESLKGHRMNWFASWRRYSVGFAVLLPALAGGCGSAQPAGSGGAVGATGEARQTSRRQRLTASLPGSASTPGACGSC